MKTKSFFLKKAPREPIDRIMSPFQHFLHAEATGGILLIIFTMIALVWANSPWAESYFTLFQTKLGFSIGEFEISKSLLLWINDGLMAIFFFVVGLEIKREILVGELSRPRQAALPVMAALGGMVVPALCYIVFNREGAAARGWGVPMATDIAFSLGILALLGKGIPLTAKVFLTAFAIVDDIGASLIIAIFYTEDISMMSLGIGLGIFLLMIAANIAGIRKPLPYVILGLLMWFAFLKSGVHPTIAGILAAITIPARSLINARDFLDSTKTYLDEFEQKGLAEENVLTNSTQRGALRALESACEFAQTPLQRLEYVIHSWVALSIMPIFALANAGISLGEGFVDSITSPISLGIIFGLVFGKLVGVTLFSWIGLRLGFADLPGELTWRHLFGLALLGGIGFTMALFIANLAFTDDAMLTTAKFGILAASLIAGVAGWIVLRGAMNRRIKE